MGVVFDDKSARRIARTVRKSERQALPSRGPALKRRFISGGGGSLSIELVAELPAIPDTGTLIVIWGDSTRITGGTGDNGYWIASADDTEWSPFVYFTALEGTPGE